MFNIMLTILDPVTEMELELTVEWFRESLETLLKYKIKNGRPICKTLQQMPPR
jgi:hypothetical protein